VAHSGRGRAVEQRERAVVRRTVPGGVVVLVAVSVSAVVGGAHARDVGVARHRLGQEEKFGVGGYVAVKTRFDSIRLILII